MAKNPKCTHCNKEGHYQTFCPNKPRKPIKSKVTEMSWEQYQDKKSKPKEKPKPIKKISDKQKKINVAYMALRKVFMHTNPVCQFKGCSSKSTECHHVKGRGKEYMLDTTTWMALCSHHHYWCHNNDAEARELGYIKSRLSNND